MSFITRICPAQTTADAGVTLGQVMGVDLDKWTEKVRRCEYLAEDELKALCEYVRAALCLDAFGCTPAEALICCSGSRWPDSSGNLSSGEGDTGGGVECAASERPCHGAAWVLPCNVTFVLTSNDARKCCLGATNHAQNVCRCAATSMGSSMTCLSCWRQADSCQSARTYSWATL